MIVFRNLFISAFVLFASLSICFMPATATAEMRIFNLQHKPAADLAEMVRQLVSEDAKVAAHRNTLIVNSTPAELAEIARLVQSYDMPMQMFRITVDQGSSTDTAESNMRAGGAVRQGDTRIRVGAPSNYSDSSIFVSTGDAQVRLSGQAESNVERHSVKQFITVLEGSPAFISVGRSVPFTSQLRYYSRRHPRFVEAVEYKNVDTGFQVLPEIQGSMVLLEIKPFMSFLDQENPGQIVFHDLSTSVRLPLGAWYDLAAQMASDNGLSREILASAAAGRSSERHIRIRVDYADN